MVPAFGKLKTLRGLFSHLAGLYKGQVAVMRRVVVAFVAFSALWPVAAMATVVTLRG